MRKLTLLLILMVLAGAGCARGIGAKRLPVDRTAYVEALGNSWKEQVLYNIVKLRYGDAPTFLDVENIQQAYELGATGTAKYQYAPNQFINLATPGSDTELAYPWARNTFNIELGANYKTNPTVTYKPVSGEVVKNLLLQPIPLDDLCRALQTGGEPDFILPYCVKSINNLQNNPAKTKEIGELAKIWKELKDKDAVHIVYRAVEDDSVKEGDSKGKGKTAGQEPGKTAAQKDPWDEFAGNLVKFTNTLVKKQEEASQGKGEQTKAFFVKLDGEGQTDLLTQVSHQVMADNCLIITSSSHQ